MDVAAKDRRFITETEMFSILESTSDELQLVGPKLDEMAAEVLGGGAYEPGTYVRLVEEGFYSSATIEDPAGRTQFILIFSRSPLNWLFIEAVASIQRSSLKQIFAAVDELGRHYGCKVIQCVTKLGGMFRYSLTQGYRSAGVIILKNALPA